MLDHPLYRRDPIAPQSLVLELLLADGNQALPVPHLLAAAELFGISANHIRVTLARLVAKHMVEPARRGHYRLGPASRNLAADVARWRDASRRLRPWDGTWVLAYASGPQPADKTAQQQHVRALQLLGFSAWGTSAHIRPDNLEASTEALRERLFSVGLAPNTSVFRADAFSGSDSETLRRLWDGAALNHGYASSAVQLQQWMEAAPHMPLAQAARESLVLGGAAIRQLIFDPLLPEPLVDAELRASFIDAAIGFDQFGRTIWSNFFASLPPARHPLTETTP